MNTIELQKLCDNLGLPAFRHFEEIGSTNSEALKWVLNGAPEYAFVSADSQTAGRGRSGRKWETTKGASIAISIILHPSDDEKEKIGLFSLLGGLAVQKMVEEQFQIPAQVKWPNDVLIDQKKMAGVLAESAWRGDTLMGLVLGIGINLLPSSVPEKVMFPATCLRAHTEDAILPIEIVEGLIKALINLRKTLLQPVFRENYMHKLAFINQQILLDTGNDSLIHGTILGIDEGGKIIIKNQAGLKKSFPIGDIHLRPKK